MLSEILFGISIFLTVFFGLIVVTKVFGYKQSTNYWLDFLPLALGICGIIFKFLGWY